MLRGREGGISRTALGLERLLRREGAATFTTTCVLLEAFATALIVVTRFGLVDFFGFALGGIFSYKKDDKLNVATRCLSNVTPLNYNSYRVFNKPHPF